MSAIIRLIITIMFGWLGIHKFIDKKPLQGLLYIFTFGLFIFGWIIDIVASIQFLKKTQIDKIEKTSKILGIIFTIILFVYCLGSIGTEDFSTTSFIICLVSGIAILKIFVIDNKNYNLSYTNINKTHKNISVYENKERIQSEENDENPKIRLSIGTKSYNDYNLMNTKVSCLTGKFYDEDNIILDKYKDLKTPNYILIQISEQLYPTKDIYFLDDMIELSNKFKDKYLNNADFFPFNSYWAQIRDLNEYQLKWYLYWRKEFLNNNVLDTDISYIFIFAYELICYTFNSNASFNISALERLYNSYKDLYPKLANYLPEWIDDMLSEVGYYYNLNDNDIKKVEDDSLVNSLTTINELDKININTWRKHYSESKSDLTNKQLTLLYGNQKFNNRFKKYAGSLAKYYIDNKIDIIQKWFEIKVITEKKRLFNSVPCALQRMEGTYKYKRYYSISTFDHDMNQITKLCYDLIYPQNGMNENDYVINQYKNGRYELPENFFYSHFKIKNRNIDNNKENEEKREFSIDITKIDNNYTKINYVESSKEVINFDIDEKEFINKFENNVFDKKEAQQYCIKKGKMLNAYVTSLNEKYFPIIHKEIIVVEDDILRLNIEMEENDNDRK